MLVATKSTLWVSTAKHIAERDVADAELVVRNRVQIGGRACSSCASPSDETVWLAFPSCVVALRTQCTPASTPLPAIRAMDATSGDGLEWLWQRPPSASRDVLVCCSETACTLLDGATLRTLCEFKVRKCCRAVKAVRNAACLRIHLLYDACVQDVVVDHRRSTRVTATANTVRALDECTCGVWADGQWVVGDATGGVGCAGDERHHIFDDPVVAIDCGSSIVAASNCAIAVVQLETFDVLQHISFGSVGPVAVTFLASGALIALLADDSLRVVKLRKPTDARDPRSDSDEWECSVSPTQSTDHRTFETALVFVKLAQALEMHEAEIRFSMLQAEQEARDFTRKLAGAHLRFVTGSSDLGAATTSQEATSRLRVLAYEAEERCGQFQRYAIQQNAIAAEACRRAAIEAAAAESFREVWRHMHLDVVRICGVVVEAAHALRVDLNHTEELVERAVCGNARLEEHVARMHGVEASVVELRRRCTSVERERDSALSIVKDVQSLCLSQARDLRQLEASAIQHRDAQHRLLELDEQCCRSKFADSESVGRQELQTTLIRGLLQQFAAADLQRRNTEVRCNSVHAALEREVNVHRELADELHVLRSQRDGALTALEEARQDLADAREKLDHGCRVNRAADDRTAELLVELQRLKQETEASHSSASNALAVSDELQQALQDCRAVMLDLHRCTRSFVGAVECQVAANELPGFLGEVKSLLRDVMFEVSALRRAAGAGQVDVVAEIATSLFEKARVAQNALLDSSNSSLVLLPRSHALDIVHKIRSIEHSTSVLYPTQARSRAAGSTAPLLRACVLQLS